MKHIILITLLMVISGKSAAMNSKDGNAAVFYMQSVTLPLLTENCQKVWPEFEGVYSIAVARWQDSNQKLVKRGKKVTSRESGLKGDALERKMQSQTQALYKEITESTLQEQKSQCTRMLETMVSEI